MPDFSADVLKDDELRTVKRSCVNAMCHSISENVRERRGASLLLQTRMHAGE